MKSFLQFHRTGGEPLRDEELAILKGVLELNANDVERILTPLHVSAILSGLADSCLGRCGFECR